VKYGTNIFILVAAFQCLIAIKEKSLFPTALSKLTEEEKEAIGITLDY
jgi:hypothetical protein